MKQQIPTGWEDETDEWFDPGAGIAIIRTDGLFTSTVRSQDGGFSAKITAGLANWYSGAGTVRFLSVANEEWDAIVTQVETELTRLAALNKNELRDLVIAIRGGN